MIWVMFWNIFLPYKTLKAILTFFFSSFVQLSFSNEKFIYFQLDLFIKGLVFVILSGCFLIWSRFNVTVAVYWKCLLSFLLIGLVSVFLFIRKSMYNLYIIHHDSDLFYDIYNIINEHNQRQTHHLSSVRNYFDIYWVI